MLAYASICSIHAAAIGVTERAHLLPPQAAIFAQCRHRVCRAAQAMEYPSLKVSVRVSHQRSTSNQRRDDQRRQHQGCVVWIENQRAEDSQRPM